MQNEIIVRLKLKFELRLKVNRNAKNTEHSKVKDYWWAKQKFNELELIKLAL